MLYLEDIVMLLKFNAITAAIRRQNIPKYETNYMYAF